MAEGDGGRLSGARLTRAWVTLWVAHRRHRRLVRRALLSLAVEAPVHREYRDAIVAGLKRR